MGEFKPKGTPSTSNRAAIETDYLISAVEKVCEVAREDLCGKAKGRRLVAARETLILAGRRAGMSAKALSDLTGLSIATISRRHDAAMCRLKLDDGLEKTTAKVLKHVERK